VRRHRLAAPASLLAAAALAAGSGTASSQPAVTREATPPPAAARESSDPIATARAALAEARERLAAADHAAAEAAYRRGLEALGEATAGETAELRRELLRGLAEALYRAGKTGESVATYRVAAALAASLGDRKAETDGLAGIAAGLFVLGRYDEALAAALAAQRVADELGLTAQGSHASHLAGMVHRNLQQYPEALACLRRSAELARAAGATPLLIRALNEEANVLHFSGSTDAALECKREAIALARASSDDDALADCLNDLAGIAMDAGDYATARVHLEEAFAITRRVGDPRERVISATNLAGVLGYLGDSAQARALLAEALEAALAKDLPAEEEIARGALAYTLYDAGEVADAYRHLDRAYQLRQERLTAEAARRTADLRALYEAERREAEIGLLKRDRAIQELTIERETARRRWWAAGFAVVALFAVVLGTGWRMKARSARALAIAKRRVEELARTDPLTGLANRRHAIERLQDEARRAQRGHAPFALVLADLDHFKRVNDTHGHACGDYVLARFADIAAACVRALDVAARWGGEEFLLILPGTDAAGASTLAEKVRARLFTAELSWRGDPVPVTATFGVAACSDGDVDACLRVADAALYRGKESGRNTVVAGDAP
jgi:diguanylate cyclase (GGDEF)-like protein